MMNKYIDIYQLEGEYKYPKGDIFNDLSIDTLKILKILNDEDIIKAYEKRIFLLYLECGSLRKTESYCGISYRKIGNVVTDVRKKIIYNL